MAKGVWTSEYQTYLLAFPELLEARQYNESPSLELQDSNLF